MKFPGTYVVYALIMFVFGQTIEGIHLGLLIVNSCTIILVYFLGRRFSSSFAGIVAAAVYAVLSLNPSVQGHAAHATQFVVLPAIGGTLLLLRAFEKQNRATLFFWSGLVTGLASIMKQPGFFFVLCSASFVIQSYFAHKDRLSWKLSASRMALLAFGALVPMAATITWLAVAGVFERFWFWSVQYASEYVSQVPLSHAFNIFAPQFRRVVNGYYLVWGLSLLGVPASMLRRGPKLQSRFILLFTFFSFLSICPGFYFRENYFVTLLPALAILLGITADLLRWKSALYLRPPLPALIGAGVVVVAIGMGVAAQREFVFESDPIRISRQIYGRNPFPEAVQVAHFIASKSDTMDKIAVLGSEPEIYFYSGRMSATGYIYTYSLMEDQSRALAMQKEMIAEIESAKPKFIVVVSTPTSWAEGPHSEEYIFRWMSDYLPRNYASVGVADILSPNVTNYVWDDNAATYEIRGNSAIRVFSKKSHSPP